MDTHLKELIGRLERCAGPDRELDAHIAASVGLPMTFCDFDAGCYHGDCISPGCGKPLGLTDERRSYPADWRDDERLPHYTSSIDAAISLVPRPMCWNGGEVNEDDQPWACITDSEGADYAATAATPILALCIAALKARSLPAI